MLGSLVKAMNPSAQTVSVWVAHRKEYDYYLVPRGVTIRMAPPLKGAQSFGDALNEMLPSLPSASIRVGHGGRAQGRVVMDRRPPRMGLGAVLALVLDKLERA